MRTFTVSGWGRTYECWFEIGKYYNSNQTAIQVFCRGEEGYPEPYAIATTRLARDAHEGCVYLDVNNWPEGEEIFEELGIGEATGYVQRSGYCIYPEYRIDFEKLKEYTGYEEVDE